MTAGLYPRHLEIALDDTLGPEGRLRQLELDDNTLEGNREGVIGLVDGHEQWSMEMGLLSTCPS
jgi:hypothetical protein